MGAICQVLLGSAMARDVSTGNRLNLDREDALRDETEDAIEECLMANNLTFTALEVLANSTGGGNLTATISATVTEETALDTYTCIWERFPGAVSYITIQLAMGGTPDNIEISNRVALVAQDRFPCFGLCAATYKIVKLLLIPLCFWFPLG